MRHRIGITTLVIFFVLAFCGLASAQNIQDALPKNTHMFAPTSDNSGIITTYGSEHLGTLWLAYSFWFDAAISPLDYIDPINNQQVTLTTYQAAGTVNFAFGITDYVNIGYSFPYIVSRAFDENYDPDNELGTKTNTLEDMRLDLKLLLLRRSKDCLGLGLITTATIPMYEKNNFSSDKGATVAPRLLFDIGRGRFTWAINLGYKYYGDTPDPNRRLLLPDLEIGDELVMGTGAKVRFAWNQELLIDTAVKTLASSPFGNPDADYAEVMAAYRKYWVRLNYNALTMGGAVGVTEGVGTPFFRIFVGFGRDESRLHFLVSNPVR